MSKKINVLQFISPTGFYGAERWILALIRNLKKGNVINPLLVTKEGATESLEIESQYKKFDEEVYSVYLRHTFDLLSIFKISKILKEKEIDIIHTHNYKSNLLGLLAAKLAGVTCIITPHGYDDPKIKKLRFYNWLDKKILKYADAVAPLSPQLLGDCREANVPENKLFYVQNGVDTDELDESLEQPLADKNARKIMGYIGQLISRKNIDHILGVYFSLKSKVDGLELHIIGDGVEMENLKRLANNDEGIKFLGFRDDRLQLLRNFDVFVMTSKLEGVPRCLMEASAVGIPIAAYEIPGVDKIVKHTENGLLSNYGDVETLSQHCLNILTDDELKATMGVNGKLIVSREFSADRMAKEYIEIYTKTLAKKDRN